MGTHSWLKRGCQVLFPALLLGFVACSAGDPADTAGTGGSSVTATGGSVPISAGSGTGVGTGGVSASSGSGSTPAGVGGMSVATGGSLSPSGGSSSVGGAVVGTGGVSTEACASVTCPSGQTCANGACTCATGMACPDGCYDTQNDQNHCGNCTTKCSAEGACVSGVCVNPTCAPDMEQRQGHITTYQLATSMVACHYPTNTLPQYYGAMNEYDWKESGVCGACVEITNSQNQKKLTVQITDECPFKGNEQWCKQGSHHIDLNGAAYGALGANNNPAISWKFVPCTTTGNLKYYFDKAVQQYYLAVTPMNFANVVAKMEVQVMGVWTALTRTNYGTYELKTGAGIGALNFRLTDIYNHIVVESVMMQADKVVDGTKQFGKCP